MGKFPLTLKSCISDTKVITLLFTIEVATDDIGMMM